MKKRIKKKIFTTVTPIDAITLREIITILKDLLIGVTASNEPQARSLIRRLEKLLSRIEY